MPRCYFTGVAMQMDDAFVFNRRAAKATIASLQHQIQSLQRLLDQLGPMDATPSSAMPVANGKQKHLPAPRQHRLACKSMALALAQGFPEVDLFESWPAYRAQAHGQPKAKPPVTEPDHAPN